MAKKSETAELKALVEAKDKALGEARKGLLRIANIDPVTYQASAGGLKIVKDFEAAQIVAERTLLKVSDADAVVA